MDLIQYKSNKYHKFQTQGNASQFAIPYAKHFCKGTGYDIGCKYKQWSLPGSVPIDLEFDDAWDAMHLPYSDVDYIYSSHCLQHIDDWVMVMDYWRDTLKVGGVLFLYLPSYQQQYWRPWNNRKHKHIFTREIIIDYMKDRGYVNIYNSETDLNKSFMVVGERG